MYTEPVTHVREINMSSNDKEVTADTSAIWKNHVSVPDTPQGFTVRTTYPANPDGAEVMLERWQAGSEEPPHSHPGDDMTVVIEGKMSIQFYTKSSDGLVPDGEKIYLNKGDTGYIKAGRIHDAKYIEDCKLVYVHDKAFGFSAEDN
jgi:quercetin dioxygenase-like cupin family protein